MARRIAVAPALNENAPEPLEPPRRQTKDQGQNTDTVKADKKVVRLEIYKINNLCKLLLL